MTGNGLYHTIYKNGDDWGMVRMALLFSHIIWLLVPKIANYIFVNSP